MAGGAAWHAINERVVRILLECILVIKNNFTTIFNKYQYVYAGLSRDDRFVMIQIAPKIILTYQHRVSSYLTE